MINLADQEYLRHRLEPRPGDVYYLHLSDLALALRSLIPSGMTRVLDYGCGGSPYRSLFGDCTYHRADLRGTDSIDFEFGPELRLPPEAGGYDCVLSTQVLEHVENPKVYLQECYRVLRPGGRLILTTHGLFEDHGCPYDYWRWTVYGLQQDVEAAGLTVQKMQKLTTGPRGALFLAERELHRLQFWRAGLYGLLISAGVLGIRALGARRRHKASDISFPGNRVVDTSDAGHHDMYIAIALLAHKPST